MYIVFFNNIFVHSHMISDLARSWPDSAHFSAETYRCSDLSGSILARFRSFFLRNVPMQVPGPRLLIVVERALHPALADKRLRRSPRHRVEPRRAHGPEPRVVKAAPGKAEREELGQPVDGTRQKTQRVDRGVVPAGQSDEGKKQKKQKQNKTKKNKKKKSIRQWQVAVAVAKWQVASG
jgi:hypothetical protein